MSLPVLVILVVVGISAIVLAVHLTGGTRKAALPDEQAARERFAVDYPHERPRRVLLTRAGDAAFLELEAGRTGIVHAFGGHFLTRIVSPADLKRIEAPSPHELALIARDFTWRGGRFAFASAGDARAVAERLSPILTTQRSPA